MTKFLKILPLLAATFVLVLFLQFNTSAGQTNSEDQICPEGKGWVKIDGTAPSYTAKATQQIAEICVKGGPIRHFFTSNGYTASSRYFSGNPPQNTIDDYDPNCWEVSGIGTNVGNAWKRSSSNNISLRAANGASELICHDISHASFRLIPSSCEYELCTDMTDAIYGDWSTEWLMDEEEGKEYRARTFVKYDFYNEKEVCEEGEERYYQCDETVAIDPVWSAWKANVDGITETRTAPATVDSTDAEIICSTTVENRNIAIPTTPSTPAVSGISTEVVPAVLGTTTVALTDTAGPSTFGIYAIQAMLVLSLLGAGAFFAKPYFLKA